MTATLQMLLDEGIGLRCWCAGCSRSWVLKAEPLATIMHPWSPVQAAALEIICEKCGKLHPEVQPDWPRHGVNVTPIP